MLVGSNKVNKQNYNTIKIYSNFVILKIQAEYYLEACIPRYKSQIYLKLLTF